MLRLRFKTGARVRLSSSIIQAKVPSRVVLKQVLVIIYISHFTLQSTRALLQTSPPLSHYPLVDNFFFLPASVCFFSFTASVYLLQCLPRCVEWFLFIFMMIYCWIPSVASLLVRITNNNWCLRLISCLFVSFQYVCNIDRARILFIFDINVAASFKVLMTVWTFNILALNQ